jgi:hypothetical protein
VYCNYFPNDASTKAHNLTQYSNQNDKEEEGHRFLVKGTVIGDTYIHAETGCWLDAIQLCYHVLHQTRWSGMFICRVAFLSCTTQDDAIQQQLVLSKLYCTSCQVEWPILMVNNINFLLKYKIKTISENKILWILIKILTHSKYIIHWSIRNYVPSPHLVCMDCSHPSYQLLWSLPILLTTKGHLAC